MSEDDKSIVTEPTEWERAKLTKFSKGYGWEISVKSAHLNEEDFKRIESINDMFVTMYGSVKD